MSEGQTFVFREMPKYRCHKEVWAVKIAAIEWHDDGGATITPADEGYYPFNVDTIFTRRNEIKFGWYFIIYKDGYKSASPAEAFEEGYSRIEAGQP